MKTFKNKNLVLALVLTAAVSASCTSFQNNSALEALQGIKPSQPIVEGFFEFGGPDPKWAGPVAFVVHVKAGDDGKTVVQSNPDVRAVGDSIELSSEARVPASASVEGISSAKARAKLGEIGELVSNDERMPAGCLYPVRVRLVRLDGSLIERQGCRSSQGWTGAVSRAVGFFLGG